MLRLIQGCDKSRQLHVWLAQVAVLALLLALLHPALGQEDPKQPAAKPAPKAKVSVTDQQDPVPKPKPSPKTDTGDEESEVQPEPPSVVPPRPRLSESQLAQIRSLRSPSYRLARVPNMFGDFINPQNQILISGAFDAWADIPTSGVLGRSKVSENNKAVTMDRFYVTYNHFHNALQGDIDMRDTVPATDISVNRTTLGLEKSFLCNLWSVELRMPLVSRYDFGVPKFSVSGDEIGNLNIILKRQLVTTCTTGVVAGVGIDVPTGGDLAIHGGNTDFTLHNDAVHLAPYLGMVHSPNECMFYHGFVQVDLPLNGNRVEYAVPYPLVAAGQFGKLTEQTLLQVDVGAGRWLYRNCCDRIVTGLAAIAEVHYATTLDDTDMVYGVVPPQRFQFTNMLNRVDSVQFTVGLHAQLGPCTTFRVGGAFPLNSGPDRPFDAEVLVSLNRYF